MGGAMAPSRPAAGVGAALRLAIGQRGVGPELSMHRERGSHDASELHRDWRARQGLQASLSRTGNGGDNRVMERCLLSLNMERVWHQDDAQQAAAEQAVADDMVGFYHPSRWHSTLRYQSPRAYEQSMAEQALIAVSEKT